MQSPCAMGTPLVCAESIVFCMWTGTRWYFKVKTQSIILSMFFTIVTALHLYFRHEGTYSVCTLEADLQLMSVCSLLLGEHWHAVFPSTVSVVGWCTYDCNSWSVYAPAKHASTSLKWGLLGWSKHVAYTVLDYQPENVGKHANVLTVMHRSCSPSCIFLTSLSNV